MRLNLKFSKLKFILVITLIIHFIILKILWYNNINPVRPLANKPLRPKIKAKIIRCPTLKQEIDCYYKKTEDDFPQFEKIYRRVFGNGRNSTKYVHLNGSSSSSTRNIFFHETSCRGDLTPRQACSIESAARAHPNWTIYVLFSGPVSKDVMRRGVLSVITYSNIKFRRVFIKQYVKATPLYRLVVNGNLSRSKYPWIHTSDLLRYTTLYKYPGIYLDLDIIVSKPLDSLSRSFVIRETDTAVCNGVLAFGDDEVGRGIAEMVAEETSTTFRGDLFAYNGPGALTRVLKRWCRTSKIVDANETSCKGLSVYGPKMAFPIHWEKANIYFQPGILYEMDETHLYHVWGQISSCYTSYKDSPYHKLAMKYCPKVYKAFRSEFGWRNEK